MIFILAKHPLIHRKIGTSNDMLFLFFLSYFCFFLKSVVKLLKKKETMEALGGKFAGVYKNVLKDGSIAFFVAYRDAEGKVVKKKVGTHNRTHTYTATMARDALNHIKLQLSKGEEITNPKKKTPTLDECFEFFQKGKTTKASLRTDIERYNTHLKSVFGRKEVNKITPQMIEDFKVSKLGEINTQTKRLNSPQTVQHIISLLRNIINFGIKKDFIKSLDNPVSKVDKIKIDNKKVVFLSHEQAKELLEILNYNPNRRLYQLTVLLLFTGARFSEVAKLRWYQVNLNTGLIYFPKCKDGNERHIKTNEKVKSVINELLPEKLGEGDLVIKNSKNEVFREPPDQLQKAIDLAVPGNEKADSIHRITVHSLRHTHASWLALAGLDLLSIKEQLGHRKIETTMRYAHLISSKRHDVTESFVL